mgnify:CR=1 FL=1|jgi:hypothetical protein
MGGTAQTQQFMTDLKVDMTPDTTDIRTTATVNAYGERAYTGGATTYDCYIRRSEAGDRDLNEKAIVEWVVYIPDASLTLDIEDQITLPAPVSDTRPIIRVDTKKDNYGQVGVIVYVGRAR